jgi:hypothetical protein
VPPGQSGRHEKSRPHQDYIPRNFTSFHITFCKAAQSAAFAAIPICREVEVHAFQSNVLQLILHHYYQHIKKSLVVFYFSPQTRVTSKITLSISHGVLLIRLKMLNPECSPYDRPQCKKYYYTLHLLTSRTSKNFMG